jgi:hypothetical protein
LVVETDVVTEYQIGAAGFIPARFALLPRVSEHKPMILFDTTLKLSRRPPCLFGVIGRGFGCVTPWTPTKSWQEKSCALGKTFVPH